MGNGQLKTILRHGSVLLQLPLLTSEAFKIESANIKPMSVLRSGCSGFDLADLLELLPNQSRSHLLETETVTVPETFFDGRSYYCRCSRHGLFEFITQHFSSIRLSNDRLQVQTDVGRFTLKQTDRRLLVHFDAHDRASSKRAPSNQDYSALRKIAAGMWCVRAGDELNSGGGYSVAPETVNEWKGPFDVDTTLCLQNISHPRCIYFLASDFVDNLETRKRFASKCEESLIWLFEKRRESFPFMSESIDLLTVLRAKQFTAPEYLDVHVRAVKMMLADAMNHKGHTSGPIDTAEAEAFITRCAQFNESLLEAYNSRSISSPREWLDLL